MGEHVILGMLQNMWVRDPVTIRRVIREKPSARRRMIALWMPKTPSGRALRAAFGDLFDRIVWDNAASAIGGQSDAAPKADHVHIAGLLRELQPSIVLAFGRKAVDALRQHNVPRLIESRHPSPRAAGCRTLPSLDAAASELRSALLGEGE